MTDKKKIDEAAILNVQNSINGMTGETTFVADDMLALAQLLKSAGLESGMYNGPATLSVETAQGTGSVTSRVNAPDLRSIMNLLQPEFQQIGDPAAEPTIEPIDPEADARAQAHSDLDKAFNDGQEAGVEIYDPGMAPTDPSEPKTCAGDCDAEVDMGMDLDSPIDDQEVQEEADYDYRTNDVHPQEYAGVADKKPVQPDTKTVPSRSADNPIKGFKDYFKEAADRNYVAPVEIEEITTESLLSEFNRRRTPPTPTDFNTVARKAREASKGGYVQHVDRHEDGAHSVSDWMSDKTVGSFSNGHNIGGQDIDESELDEAGRSNYAEKSRQFGTPYYLNTDCGFASLEDLGTHDYFHGDGVVVLAINRSGKWGLNYVSGQDSTAPGTKVTCVTQTSTGQKYREGKVVDSFTMDEYNNDRAGLEKRLAAHGITPTKKLSVKTFD